MLTVEKIYGAICVLAKQKRIAPDEQAFWTLAEFVFSTVSPEAKLHELNLNMWVSTNPLQN